MQLYIRDAEYGIAIGLPCSSLAIGLPPWLLCIVWHVLQVLTVISADTSLKKIKAIENKKREALINALKTLFMAHPFTYQPRSINLFATI